MPTGALTERDLSAIRAKHKAGKTADLGAEIVKAAGKKARELSKEAGVTDPVLLDKVIAGGVHKDPDGNWLFNY